MRLSSGPTVRSKTAGFKPRHFGTKLCAFITLLLFFPQYLKYLPWCNKAQCLSFLLELRVRIMSMLLTVKSPGSCSRNICELNVSNDNMFWKFFTMVTMLSISHSLSHNTATLEKLCHDDPNFTVEEIRKVWTQVCLTLKHILNLQVSHSLQPTNLLTSQEPTPESPEHLESAIEQKAPAADTL